jgi:alkylation response protein AidB-like acyl-CoA dehydrogenase
VFLPAADGPRWCEDVLAIAAAHAAEADRTRTVAPEVIAAVRASGLLSLSATKRLGGGEASIATMADELGALAAACASTAWCAWNHLCVFHLFCGALGPDHTDLLAGIVERREWVCFPAGAGSGLVGREDGGDFVLDGRAAFGSGARYADWAGVAFAVADADGRARRPVDLRFSIVRLDSPGVHIDPTWDGASLRASSTDDVIYEGVRVPAERCVPWYGANRAAVLRDPSFPVIDGRYREDWVGLSDLWLAAMAVRVTGAALDQLVGEVGGRKAIMGRPMSELAGVHFNLGRAATALLGARSAVVDARIEGGEPPDETDELRQAASSAFALEACDRAFGHLLKVAGGNGLRERHPFERRHRDFQAMPLHINAHEDRVTERVGRHLLGLPLDKF